MSKVFGLALAAFMGITGATHFTAPTYYRKLVPVWVPAAPAVVVLSGLLDIGVATLLAVPGTRRRGGWATAALIAAYLAAHVETARHARRARGTYKGPVGAAAALLVNLGYIAWALIVARTAPLPRPRSGGGARPPL
jgi:uncharacterized membrane protein